MNTNCEKMCKRCIDHIDFWTKPDAGGNITHVAGKKALARLRKMDEQMVTMWHHSNLALCKGCVYARPFFAAAAAAGKAKFPDVTVWAAIDCSKTEKTCSKMKFKSEVPRARPARPSPADAPAPCPTARQAAVAARAGFLTAPSRCGRTASCRCSSSLAMLRIGRRSRRASTLGREGSWARTSPGSRRRCAANRCPGSRAQHDMT